MHYTYAHLLFLTPLTPQAFPAPTSPERQEAMEKTKLALEKLVSGKIKASQPLKGIVKQAEAEYIRYAVL